MLERSTIGENALQALHDEDYAAPYDTRTLTHKGLLFTGGRTAQVLDGDWNFCVDLLDTGLRQKWFSMLPAAPETRTEPWDYDPYMGETVRVPANWQMLKEKWYFYEGSAWYTRPLDHSARAGRRQILRIGAAQYDCKVFLNGKFLGNHLGGSTPFCVELTHDLQDGRNWLMLCVNNTRTLDRVPMRNTDWFNYGGIYRETQLFDLPAAFISDMGLRLGADGASIAVDLEIDGGDNGDVQLSIPELGLDQSIPVTNGRASAVIPARPELWSPDNPKLYDVHARFGDDMVTDRVGFRTITRQGTEILLNGKPVWLRGISVHEDDLTLGKVTTEDDLRARFQHAKELGCNFLRLAHYPHHERAAQLADELGFMLWQEIPVYWAVAFDNPDTYADAENQLLELIRRDRNRASVIIWSIGNENPDTDARLSFMRALADAARRADDTRLIAAACLINHTRNRIEDRLAEHLDVIGINEYYGWYDENITDLIEIGRNSAPDRPVVISETGADGAIGKGAPETGLFSEAYMTQVYRQQIEILRDLDYVKGMSPWILYDFRVERRQNIFQNGFNKKGLIAADKRTKKSAFGVLAQFYHARARGGDLMARAARRYQEVAEGLRKLILQGGYSPGDRILTERQIAEHLRVGRSAAREAILLMEIEGVLEVRKGSGIYLKDVGTTAAPKGDANDIGPFELIQARQLLESAVAGLAASTVTKADIMRMRDALELERSSIATGAQDYSGDELFHRLIAEATQNSVLVDTVNELWEKREGSRMWARLHERIFVTDYRLRWLDDHSAILAALQRRDPEAARRAMWQHLENVRVTLLELSDDEDPGFDGYLFDSREVSKVFR